MTEVPEVPLPRAEVPREQRKTKRFKRKDLKTELLQVRRCRMTARGRRGCLALTIHSGPSPT